MIQTDRPHLVVAAQSHPGETGKNNEDAFSVTSYVLDDGKVASLLAVVADGIGGHQAGEVAARLAVEALIQRVGAFSGREPLKVLRAGVIEASRAIQRAASNSPDQEGMGSTIAVAWEIGGKLYTVSVGDSRIYLLRGEALRRLTTDHTWVQEALDHGIIKPEEVKDHPHAHVLRRYLGGAQEPQPDFRLRLRADESDARAQANQGMALRGGDRFLVCSDGLTDLVTDAEIQSILGHQEPAAATQAFIDLARERGGHDNITVICAVIPPRQRNRLSARGFLLMLVLLLLLVAAGSLALWWLGLWPW